jgi:hypothetical protein
MVSKMIYVESNYPTSDVLCGVMLLSTQHKIRKLEANKQEVILKY